MTVSKPIDDTWQQGDPYDRYMGRWSRRMAPAFVTWVGLPVGRRWAEIGCGTGALTEAILDGAAPASVDAVEPSEGFRATAHKRLGDRARFHAGNATSIPLADASVDATVSGLVLNFVPDARAALVEMARVTVPGGTIAAYVWDYAGRMELVRVFWEAASEVDPRAATAHEGARFPLCHPDALKDVVSRAGLAHAKVAPLDIETRFADFDDYWTPFLGGQGPAPAYAISLDEATRTRLRERLRERLAPHGGPLALVARAWAVRAQRGA